MGFPWIFLLLIHLTSLPCLLGHLDRPCSPWNSNYKRHCLNAQANCPRPMEIICLRPYGKPVRTETAQFKKTFTDTLKKGNFAWSVHCIQKRIFSIQSPPQIFSLLGHYLTPPPGRLDTSNDSATFPNRPQQKH